MAAGLTELCAWTLTTEWMRFDRRCTGAQVHTVKLPFAERAIVDASKVRDYLLSTEHPVGRFKARVFGAAGYRQRDWSRLHRDFLALATTIDVELTASDKHGQRFVGTGVLVGPNGSLLPVTTIWIIRSGEAEPRFVTAYPGST
jgi:hypothetical protein